MGIWHGLDEDSGSRAPDAALSSGGLYLDAADDALVIVTSDGTIEYFASASSLSSDSEPETLDVAADLLYAVDLSSDARMLVTVGPDSVYVVDQGPSGLSLRATLPHGEGDGRDVALVE
jgi:hypothetical protein